LFRVWCSVSHSRRKEKGRIYLEDARRRQSEDATNGAAARPVVAAREGRAREERVGDKGKGEGNRDEAEALSPELSMSRAPASPPTEAGVG